MALAGALEIQMFAGLVRLQKDMNEATRVVGGAMSKIESSVSMAKKALGALGIGLGVGYFVSLVKGSIDAMDKLRDLSKTTNITVEQLAGLRLAAQQSGSNLEGAAKSISFLSKNIGANADEYRKLGITAKDPLEAFKQLSDLFTKLEDPQQRSAIMAKALGKAWEGAAPLLSEGGKRIGEMVERGTKLSGVTKEMTEEADKLNDKWAELTSTGGTMTRMVGPLLPLLNLLADSMVNNKEKTDSLVQSFNPLVEVLKVLIILGSDVKFVFETIGKDIARAVENVQLIAKGDFAGSRALGETFRKDAEAARKALDAYQKQVMGTGLTGQTAGVVGGGGDASAAARAAAFLGGDKDKDNASMIARQLQEGMDEEVRIMSEVSQITDDFRRRERELDRATVDERNRILIEAYDREQAEAIAHGETMLEIERVIAEQKKIQKQKEQAGLNTFLNNMAGLMNTQSKKVFELGKKAAIAQAVYKGGLAVMDAWEAGMSVGGPWAPLVAAAYAAAAAMYSLNLINNIRSQTFGGGAGGAGGGVGGGVPISPTQGDSNISPAGAGGEGRGQMTIYNLHGSSFSRSQVRELLEMQNENSVDGSRTIVVEH